ncbi:potassium-transporting ATPase subunit C [Opitutus sp. ER46]|uniref:potassium-transporting ATPase subunit C n=1 Tax=Opitutus sp. ER46 TaxID=2161864 RepID=UPI000D3259E0|nr:potassium-transporting ATPase subunit C [Opitutus sp. ER46]PTX92284.1 potassium-transporting ATPase subunit C [Opitutus sp. ER46]
MKTTLSAARLLVALTLLTGFLYPLAVWAVGHTCFASAAEGSLVYRQGRLVGSTLLAQPTTSPRYFQPRPSAGDFATGPSGASNLAWTSAKLQRATEDRLARFGAGVPPDLLTTSGSGLDPHISPAAARYQAGQVATVRQLPPAQTARLLALIARQTEGGRMSPARINVLRLNLALDAEFSNP